jgi:hypothetical protein
MKILKSICNATFLGEIPMQPVPHGLQTSPSKKTDWIAVATLAFSAGSFLAGSLAIYFSVKAVIEKGNSDLVNIGVSILRVDPGKEKQISEATREWALNLIDANAGGVKFSQEARAQLLRKPLSYDNGWGASDFGSVDTFPTKPAAPRPAPEPPK